MTERSATREKTWRRILPIALVLGLIAAATLVPGATPVRERTEVCILCGERGASDAIANVVLFLPLGLALGLLFRSCLVFAIPLLISLLIEAAQAFLLTGRHASLGDVLFNSIGGVLGLVAAHRIDWWFRPTPATERILRRLMLLVIGFIIIATPLLMEPAPPRSLYYGQWTADFGHLEQYHGRIESALIGETAVPEGLIEHSAEVRRAIADRQPIRVRGTAGPPPPNLAPLLSVYDNEQREVVLVGFDADDVVLRYRTRAATWRLDQVSVRAPGLADGLRPGETLFLEVHPSTDRACFRLNHSSMCQPLPHVGSGWQLVFSAEFPPYVVALLDQIWLGLLALPLGFWSLHKRTWLLMAAASETLLLAVPALTEAPGLPLSVYLALAVGLLLGRMFRLLPLDPAPLHVRLSLSAAL